MDPSLETKPTRGKKPRGQPMVPPPNTAPPASARLASQRSLSNDSTPLADLDRLRALRDDIVAGTHPVYSVPTLPGVPASASTASTSSTPQPGVQVSVIVPPAFPTGPAADRVLSEPLADDEIIIALPEDLVTVIEPEEPTSALVNQADCGVTDVEVVLLEPEIVTAVIPDDEDMDLDGVQVIIPAPPLSLSERTVLVSMDADATVTSASGLDGEENLDGEATSVLDDIEGAGVSQQSKKRARRKERSTAANLSLEDDQNIALAAASTVASDSAQPQKIPTPPFATGPDSKRPRYALPSAAPPLTVLEDHTLPTTGYNRDDPRRKSETAQDQRSPVLPAQSVSVGPKSDRPASDPAIKKEERFTAIIKSAKPLPPQATSAPAANAFYQSYFNTHSNSNNNNNTNNNSGPIVGDARDDSRNRAPTSPSFNSAYNRTRPHDSGSDAHRRHVNDRDASPPLPERPVYSGDRLPYNKATHNNRPISPRLPERPNYSGDRMPYAKAAPSPVYAGRPVERARDTSPRLDYRASPSMSLAMQQQSRPHPDQLIQRIEPRGETGGGFVDRDSDRGEVFRERRRESPGSLPRSGGALSSASDFGYRAPYLSGPPAPRDEFAASRRMEDRARSPAQYAFNNLSNNDRKRPSPALQPYPHQGPPQSRPPMDDYPHQPIPRSGSGSQLSGRDSRDSRDLHDLRDPRDIMRDPRDTRDARDAARDSRDPRDSRELLRGDPRDLGRDPRALERDPRELDRDPRDGGRGPRDLGRDTRDLGRDPRDDGRDPRDLGRDPRDLPRDTRAMSRDPRDDRDFRGFRDERGPPSRSGANAAYQPNRPEPTYSASYGNAPQPAEYDDRPYYAPAESRGASDYARDEPAFRGEFRCGCRGV